MMILSLAGLRIGVRSRFFPASLCAGFLDESKEAPDFEVEVTDAELLAERAVKPASDAALEFVCAYRQIAERLPEYDAFVLHSAAVAAEDKAYLFTAPSGTGKTTHLRNWLRLFSPLAWVINGDKPVIRRIDGVFYACGSPWQGKEAFGAPGSCPVRAICLLSQSPDNRMERVSGAELLRFLMRQVYLPKDPARLARFFDLLDAFVQNVPAYHLACNMTNEAVQLSYKTMSGNSAAAFSNRAMALRTPRAGVIPPKQNGASR